MMGTCHHRCAGHSYRLFRSYRREACSESGRQTTGVQPGILPARECPSNIEHSALATENESWGVEAAAPVRGWIEKLTYDFRGPLSTSLLKHFRTLLLAHQPILHIILVRHEGEICQTIHAESSFK